MKNRKLISVLLSIVMCLTLTGVIPPATVSAESPSTTATRGVYWFETHENGADLMDSYIYDDSLLTGDSKEFNWQLATMTYELAITSMSSEREPKTPEGYANKSWNLRAYLEDNGFVDFDTNDFYKEKMTYKSMGAACAHKKIMDGGKEYTLLAIVPRSAGYESEWGGNFVVNEETSDGVNTGDTGDHAGFKNGKNIVLGFAKEYVAKYGITGDIKVWTAGYSRGAGVDNQIGAALLRDPQGALGESVSLEPQNLYCYTFGTPATASVNGDCELDIYDYIHNVYEPYDIVTNLPPAAFGFARYGTTTNYASGENQASEERKARMLWFMEQTNKLVYDSYTSNADPDNFKPYKVQFVNKGTEDSFKIGIEMVQDDDSYLPDNQADYMASFGKSLSDATAKNADSSRAGYAATYQTAMRDLCAYYFSHTEDGGSLIDGLRASKTAIPMVISMYVMFMTEKYMGNWDATINGTMETAFNVLAAELEDENGDIKEEYDTTENAQIIEAYNAVKTKYFTRLDEEREIEIDGQVLTVYYELNDEFKTDFENGTIVNSLKTLVARMYASTMKDALTNAGADSETIGKLTSDEESRAVSYLLTYILLYNEGQSDEVAAFSFENEQFKQMATFIGNATSYMRPHNNEVILSWLRTMDSSYDDFVKEDDVRSAGYRRVYVSAPDGVKVTGVVKDGSGKQVAAFENGKLVSSTDPWVAITTCDTGNWLRIPPGDTYTIELKTDSNTKLDLKVAEFDTYDGKETRVAEKDSKYNWKGLEVTKCDTVKLTVSKSGIVEKTGYPEEKVNYTSMDGKAEYFVTIDSAHKWDGGKVTKKATSKEEGTILYACSVCGKTKTEAIPKVALEQPTIHTFGDVPKKAMDTYWEKVDGADGYKIAWRVSGGKWKTKNTTKLKYQVKGLKKGKLYEFKVAATKKATDKTAAVTGPYSKPMYRWYQTVSAKAKGLKKAVRVTWKKAKGANGYIVLVSASKKMKNPKQYVIKGGSKKKYKVKGLKKGKTYYVMVRPYKNKGGHRYDGVTTTAKKVVVK